VENAEDPLVNRRAISGPPKGGLLLVEGANLADGALAAALESKGMSSSSRSSVGSKRPDAASIMDWRAARSIRAIATMAI
jgi:hypothetical protein